MIEKLKTRGILGLKWLEKYTKTDMVYLASGGSWLGLGQIIYSLSAFITSVAFANLLPPETYGIYKYVLSIVGILSITTLTGMDSAIMQSAARGYDNTLKLGVKTKMKWGVFGTLISLLIAGYYYSQGNIVLALSFCIVSLFMPFTESFDMYNSLLFGKKLFNVQTKYNIIRKITSLIIIIGTVFITDNIFIILSVYFLTLTIPAGFFLIKTLKKYIENKKVDGEVVQYGKHLSVISAISLVAAEIDKVLIFHYLGATNLVVYTLAVAPTDQIKGVLKNINSLAFPQFALKSGEEIKTTIFNKVKILGVITAIIVAGYIIVAPFFFKIFFPQYIASVHYSQVLSISLIGAVLAGFLNTALESQKSKKELYQYNLYSNIFSLVILFPLVYYFGIWGAISSRFVSRIFSFVLSSVLIKNIS